MSEIQIVTKFPIAFDSLDHLLPLGTRVDNSRNPKFVTACERLLKGMFKDKGSILDIGCAGGGCVEDFANRGHDAYGIEGSNYSKKRKRASWKTIPDRLFTCDASRPFEIRKNGKAMLFDIVYSFEVMEHIPKRRLKIYFKNIYKHMHKDSIFVGTYTTVRSRKPRYKNHHQTIMDSENWIGFVRKRGLFEFVDLGWHRSEYLRSSGGKTKCLPLSFKKKRLK